VGLRAPTIEYYTAISQHGRCGALREGTQCGSPAERRIDFRVRIILETTWPERDGDLMSARCQNGRYCRLEAIVTPGTQRAPMRPGPSGAAKMRASGPLGSSNERPFPEQTFGATRPILQLLNSHARAQTPISFAPMDNKPSYSTAAKRSSRHYTAPRACGVVSIRIRSVSNRCNGRVSTQPETWPIRGAQDD